MGGFFHFQVERSDASLPSRTAGELRGRLSLRLEQVVPVVQWWTHTPDDRMQPDHGTGCGVTGRIGIEAAVDGHTVSDKGASQDGLGVHPAVEIHQ